MTPNAAPGAVPSEKTPGAYRRSQAYASLAIRGALAPFVYFAIIAAVGTLVGTIYGGTNARYAVWFHGWPITFLTRHESIWDGGRSPDPLPDTQPIFFSASAAIFDAVIFVAILAILWFNRRIQAPRRDARAILSRFLTRSATVAWLLSLIAVCYSGDLETDLVGALFFERPVVLALSVIYLFSLIGISIVFAVLLNCPKTASASHNGKRTFTPRLITCAGLVVAVGSAWIMSRYSLDLRSQGEFEAGSISPDVFPPYVGLAVVLATSLCLSFSAWEYCAGENHRGRILTAWVIPATLGLLGSATMVAGVGTDAFTQWSSAGAEPLAPIIAVFCFLWCWTIRSDPFFSTGRESISARAKIIFASMGVSCLALFIAHLGILIHRGSSLLSDSSYCLLACVAAAAELLLIKRNSV